MTSAEGLMGRFLEPPFVRHGRPSLRTQKKIKNNLPRAGVSSSNSTNTLPLKNCPGKYRRFVLSKRIKNLRSFRGIVYKIGVSRQCHMPQGTGHHLLCYVTGNCSSHVVRPSVGRIQTVDPMLPYRVDAATPSTSQHNIAATVYKSTLAHRASTGAGLSSSWNVAILPTLIGPGTTRFHSKSTLCLREATLVYSRGPSYTIVRRLPFYSFLVWNSVQSAKAVSRKKNKVH